ncbi:protein ROOT INITIATION DEFECTIVE 3-like isoform X2 [Coffea arabica]|uniref:Protein ROOT INITIATION DEFECTIVE 3-like isoform X2 n=1 Tax=Coffea arabica TaxID=13443 RepID=A0ABM4U8J3_COFAR
MRSLCDCRVIKRDNMDCKEALAVCSDKNISIGITIWDLENGDRLLHIPTCSSPPHGLISLRNQYLVASQVQRTGSVSGGVIFSWPLSKHQATLRSYLLESTGPLSCTRDGTYLACGATSGNIYVWEVTSGRLLKNWSAHHTSICCMVLSSDDSFLISGSADGSIAVWSMIGLLAEGNCDCLTSIVSMSKDHTGAITGLLPASTNSSSNFISSSLDGTCKVWNMLSGNLIKTKAFPLPITAIVLDLLEEILFCGSENGAIFLNKFDAGLLNDPFSNPCGEQIVLNGHQKSITALTSCKAGLVSASDDCTVCLWDTVNYTIIRRFNHFKGPISNLVAISKSSLIPKNNQRTSQFRVCVLDKNSQPTNFAKETVKLLPSSSAQEEADAMLGCRSTNLLEKHILDLERGRTLDALQMKIETNRENQMWAIKMTKHTMEMNQCLQSAYLDLLHDRLLQPHDSRLKMEK